MCDMYKEIGEIDEKDEFVKRTNFENWFYSRFPKCRLVDKDFTFEKYNFPDFVRSYIINHWIYVGEEGGGTYCDPSKFDKKYTKKH